MVIAALRDSSSKIARENASGSYALPGLKAPE
jgi:hypothetical protein